VAKIRAFMMERFPHYFVPSEIVLLNTLPLTANGKVDRGALPTTSDNAPMRAQRSAAPRDDLERLVCTAFEQALGIGPIGRSDDFFLLGGDSLLALRLFATLEESFGATLPLVSLFEHPTPAQLADFLRTQSRPAGGKLSPILVEIKRGYAKMPFFLVPGGTAGMPEMTYYAGLMRHLRGGEAVYGFLARDIDGKNLSDNSVADRAAFYVAELRRVQPRGPYLLGGECVGGIVAFEMAQQLLAAGDQVALLLLMDTWCPFDGTVAMLRSRLAVARTALSNLSRLFQAQIRGVPSLGSGQVLRYWTGVFGTLNRKATSWRQTLKRIEQTMHYQPRRYPREITLLISSDNAQRGLANGWRRVSAGGLTIHTVHGDHQSYIRKTPEIVAEHLRNCLDEAHVRR
jgi:thioesterase domain-containing protein/acyl carrier protein